MRWVLVCSLLLHLGCGMSDDEIIDQSHDVVDATIGRQVMPVMEDLMKRVSELESKVSTLEWEISRLKRENHGSDWD